MFRKLRYSIRNLYNWFPIIWNDRDWDHAFIEYLLEHKLRRMYDRFSDPNKTIVNWETERGARALKALRICIVILDRRRNGFYYSGIEESYEMEQRDWKLLFTLMEKYMRWWWD